ncbi:glycoside hydrolase family 19 protein [Chryseobacterium taihuense]|uniref:Predicted chitinase n=1 Tax=Chryseobacterium taihuense TaxID=1141221 RepID=A0ABY0R3X0_9FLAO|nr:hypothetical protein [Chryseobacterium taihuense]SDM38567.1 Predicted chitinase [Chryseobacterium taihuense]
MYNYTPIGIYSSKALADEESKKKKDHFDDLDKTIIDVYFSKPEIDDLENVLEGQPKQKKRFPEIHKANLGDEIFLVARTENLIGKKLKIEIRQAKERQIADKDKPFVFSKQDKSGSITITVGKGVKDKDEKGQDYFSKYANANKLENFAWKSFMLRPENDSEFEQWKKIIENSREKKIYLYFHAEVIDDPNEDVKFLNTDKSEGEHNFANSQGQYFEIQNGDKCFCNRNLTEDDLISIGVSKSNALKYKDALNITFEDYNINTCIRKLHFLAHVRHESGEFKFQEEIASGEAYEGRSDLGNTQKGDGKRFKGRGLIQITGRNNYTKYGTDKKMNFTTEPNNKKLATLPYSVNSAGWYWSECLTTNLNIFADNDDVIYITYRINGGFNGYIEDRKPKLVKMIKKVDCKNSTFVNFENYFIKNSECWKLHDAVFKYANLNTNESKECYQRYLDLTANYLNWSSIKGWETTKPSSSKRKAKEKVEKRRAIANSKI